MKAFDNIDYMGTAWLAAESDYAFPPSETGEDSFYYIAIHQHLWDTKESYAFRFDGQDVYHGMMQHHGCLDAYL